MSQDTNKPVCEFDECEKEADVTCDNCERQVCDDHYHELYNQCVTCAYKVHGRDSLRQEQN